MADWTEPVIETMKRLFFDGLSHSQIAAELWREHHFAATRNSVIGKANRLGLDRAPREAGASRPQVPSLPHQIRPKAAPRPRTNAAQVGNGIVHRIAVPLHEPAPVPVNDAAIPPRQRKTLFQLGRCSCRWPIGTPGDVGFYFCGAAGADMARKVPYCRPHTMRAAARSAATLVPADEPTPAMEEAEAA